MDDRILPRDRGSARGAGTHFPERAREIRYKGAAKIIEEGLSSDDPLDAVPLNLPSFIIDSLSTCDCGCGEFTVLTYRCRGCGKKITNQD